MDLNTNRAKAIAILVALNAGIFVSHHHLPVIAHRSPAMQAGIAGSRSEICKAQTQAQMATREARMQTRMAMREALKAQKQIRQEATHAAAMAPMSANARVHNTVTDYVHCILASGTRSVNGGV